MQDLEKQAFLPYFFKTGERGYAEGGQFIGVVVPKIRSILKTYGNISFDQLEILAKGPFYECSLTAKPLFLLILRIMLRYAIEKFPEDLRLHYLKTK